MYPDLEGLCYIHNRFQNKAQKPSITKKKQLRLRNLGKLRRDTKLTGVSFGNISLGLRPEKLKLLK